MFQILPESHGNQIAIRLGGQLSSEDYNKLIPLLEAKIAEYGKLRAYWEMTDLDGWDAAGFWKETAFDVKHARDFDRIAVVGEAKWQETLIKIYEVFSSAEVKHFEPSQKEVAKQWVSAS